MFGSTHQQKRPRNFRDLVLLICCKLLQMGASPISRTTTLSRTWQPRNRGRDHLAARLQSSRSLARPCDQSEECIETLSFELPPSVGQLRHSRRYDLAERLVHPPFLTASAKRRRSARQIQEPRTLNQR